MTKKQCLQKIKEMFRKEGIASILKESERLLNSGAIDVSQDDKTSYAAAKCVLNVALSNISFQYKPFGEKWVKVTKNLKHFQVLAMYLKQKSNKKGGKENEIRYL